MTDSTGKNASMNADDCPWTDEEIDEMIAEDTLIEMKCTACGHIDNVPDWIIGEFAEEYRMSGKHGEVEIECPVCGSEEISRTRRITGYLTGDLDSWNSFKKAEEKDRTKHGVSK